MFHRLLQYIKLLGVWYHRFIAAFTVGRVLPALVVLAFCAFASKVKIGVLFQMNDARDRYDQMVE